MTRAVQRAVVVLLVVVVAAACGARKTRRTLVPDVPQTGSAEARSRFLEARTQFLRDGQGGAEFTAIAEEFPDDPIVPWAQLYAGIAAVHARDFTAAASSLEQVVRRADAPEGLTIRARLFLGITRNYQGDAAGALELLRQGANAVEGDSERTEFLAAVAYATAVVDPMASLPVFDQLYPRVTPTESALIVARLEEVVAAAPIEAVRRAFDQLADRRGPAMAIVATRLVIAAEQAGNAGEAERMRSIAVPARLAIGLPRTIDPGAVAGGGGRAGLVGAVLPVSRKKTGEAAIAGLGLASGASGGGGVAAVEVRAARDADEAALAVEELARKDVIAVIGPVDAASVDRAGGRAEGLQLPLLSLSGRPEKQTTGRFVFHIRHSAEQRARALAQKALSLGVTTFAILAPEDKYGELVSAAFVDEVGRGGGKIVQQVTYPPATKSFVGFAGKLTGTWQGLFVPEEARKLALIAPAVSAKKLIPSPHGTKKAAGGRPILLLSTAEDLTGAYIADAGRHSEGALLAPGFYPDDRDPLHKPFIDRFLAAFGRAPGVLEAYAYDAAQLAAAAGGGGRVGLASSLARGTTTGLTGTIRFDADHRRADPGVLYTVVEDDGAYTIRVVK
jgi:ABC-type branched-subunit amino acid transport system substrate-binding protein